LYCQRKKKKRTAMALAIAFNFFTWVISEKKFGPGCSTFCDTIFYYTYLVLDLVSLEVGW